MKIYLATKYIFLYIWSKLKGIIINIFLYIWSKLKVFDFLESENDTLCGTKGVCGFTFEDRRQ